MNSLAAKIVAALSQVQGSSIAAIDAETVEVLAGGKKNPMQGKVVKRAEGGRVMLFTNSTTNAYNNMVRKHLAEEGKNPDDFQLSPRVWGERIKDTPFVQHKGELYVEVVFLQKPSVIKYFLDGAEIAKNLIIGLKEDKAEGHQGGLSSDNKVIIRTYKLSSLKAIRMGRLSVLP